MRTWLEMTGNCEPHQDKRRQHLRISWAQSVDPWAAARTSSKLPANGLKHDFTSLEGAPTTDFEEMIVKTRFIAGDQKQLKQVMRTAYEPRTDALVLCEAAQSIRICC